jgi:hypothetical protein
MVARYNARVVPWPVDLAASLRTADRGPWPPEGVDLWDFHQDTRDALAYLNPDKLLWLEARQEEMMALRRERASIVTSLGRFANNIVLPELTCIDYPVPNGCTDDRPEFPEPSQEVLDLFERLAAVDLELQGYAQLATLEGCLEDGPTPCDWSPRWAAMALLDQYQSERRAVYAQCLAATGDDFSKLLDDDPDDGEPYWIVQQDEEIETLTGQGICSRADVLQPGAFPLCQVRDDYTVDDLAARQYVDTVQAWVIALADARDWPVDPETGRPSIANTQADRLDMADANFGVGMDYDVGWMLPSVEDAVCELSVDVHAQLRVSSKAFGLSLPLPYMGETPSEVTNSSQVASDRRKANLFFADLYSGANESSFGAHAIVDLAGTNLFTETLGPVEEDGEPGFTFHYAVGQNGFSKSERYTLLEATTTVTVGPVPVNLTAGLAGRVGVAGIFGVDIERCPEGVAYATADTRLGFEPFAVAEVYAEASAGIRGLAAIGVDTNLDVVDVGLPVQLEVRGTFDPSDLHPDSERTGLTELTLELTADLETTLLRGRIRAFVELFFDKYAKTLFRLPGFTNTINLLSKGWTADLEPLFTALDLLENPDPSLPGDGLPSQAVSFVKPDASDADCTPYRLPEPDVYVDFNDVQLAGDTLSSVLGTASFDVSSASTGQDGVHGQAMRTLATSDIDSDGGSVFPLGADGFAISLWAKPDVGASSSTLLSFGTGAQATGIEVRFEADGALSLVAGCTGGRSALVSTTPLFQGTWHHIVVNVPAASGTDPSLWVNGAYQGRAASCDVQLNDTTLHLGHLAGPNGDSRPFEGHLDELGWWSHLLNGGDIRALMLQGESGLPMYGDGTAPLTGVRNLAADLLGTSLTVTWEDPPSIVQPGYGYDDVIIRVGTAGYPASPSDGDYGATVTGGQVVLPVGLEADRFYVASFASGPAGLRAGPRVFVDRELTNLSPVANLAATSGEGSVLLRWSRPADPRVVRVDIARGVGPLDRPADGTLITRSRTDSFVDTGLVPGTTVHYTAWSVDGFGRRSPGTSVSVTVDDVALDLTPPDALVRTDVLAMPDRVLLSWELPADEGALEVEVLRSLGGLQTTLGEVSATRFDDLSVLPTLPYRYTLTPVDAAGNRGPSVRLDAHPRPHPGVVLLQAEAQEEAIALSWLTPDPGDTTEVVVVRRSDGPAESPWDGEEVCRVSPSANACVHEGAVPGEISIYTAFALAAPSNASSGLSTDPIAAEFPTISLAGDDRAVLGGERVRLLAQGQDPNSSVAWVQVAGSPVDLLDADTSRPWFIAPDIADTLTFQVTGQIGGFAQSDTVDVAVTPYAGLQTEVLDNPFRSLLFEGVDGVTLAYDADRGIAWASTGSELIAFDPTDDTILSTTSGSWPQAREVDGDLLVLCDLYGGTVLVDVSDAAAPVEIDRLSYDGRLYGDAREGWLARWTNQTTVPTIELYTVDATGFTLDKVFERQGTGSVGGVTLLPGMLNMVVVRTQSQAPGHHAIIDLAAVATLGNQDGATLPLDELAELPTGISPISPAVADGVLLTLDAENPQAFNATTVLRRYDLSDPASPQLLSETTGGPANPYQLQATADLALVPTSDGVMVFDLDTLTWSSSLYPASSGDARDVLATPPQAPTALHVASWLGGSDAGVLRWTLGADLGPLEGVEVLTSSQLFMFPEGSAVDGRTLALRTYDDILGVHGEGSLQSTSYSQYWGSYELGSTMCIRDGVISFVENDGGAPWVSRLDLVGDDPGFSFEVDGDCGATACVGDTLVSLCAGNTEARAWSLDTGASRGTVAITGTNFPSMQAPLRGTIAMATDGDAAWFFETTDTLELVATSTLPGLSYTAMNDGLTVYATDWGTVSTWDVPAATGSTVDSTIWTTFSGDSASLDLAAGAWVETAGESLTARRAGGQSLLVQRPAGYVSKLGGGWAWSIGEGATRYDTAPAWIDGLPGHGAPAEILTGTAKLDAGVHASDVTCVVTGGTCDVLGVDSTGRLAQFTWTLPDAPGHHELAVVMGDPRWAAAAYGRVSVEAP